MVKMNNNSALTYISCLVHVVADDVSYHFIGFFCIYSIAE